MAKMKIVKIPEVVKVVKTEVAGPLPVHENSDMKQLFYEMRFKGMLSGSLQTYILEMLSRGRLSRRLYDFDSLLQEMILHDKALVVPNCKQCGQPLSFMNWHGDPRIMELCVCQNSHCRSCHSPQGMIIRKQGYYKGSFA